jgi:radical SAM-linked protein
MTAPRATRVRIRFTKAGKVRFVSHRDVARLFERALRKLRLPVAYTEGFSPRPKLSFGLALPVAYESEAEYLDVDFCQPVDLESLPSELTAALPDGLAVAAAIPVEPGTPSLQQAITSCDWHIEIVGAPEPEISAAVARVLAAAELLQERVRKGKTTVADVRPAILHLEVAGPTADGVALTARLATETVSLRPAELVRAIDADLVVSRARRTHQWMTADGARCEPVSPPGPSARHESSRAS